MSEKLWKPDWNPDREEPITLTVEGVHPVVAHQFNKYCQVPGRADKGLVLSKILLDRLEQQTGKTMDQMREEYHNDQ